MRNRIFQSLAFLAIVLLMSWFYGMFDNMGHGPYSTHMWRQADCLSISQNYQDQNLPFLEPEIMWRGESGDGKTISEFPIIYYSMGKIWSATGTQYWMWRLLDFLIMLLGLFYLRKTCIAFLGQGFWANLIPLFFFTSGLLAFYGNNFIMNVNAMSLALVGVYHFVQFYLHGERKRLWYAAGIFAFAALLKITSLLLFFAAGAILLYSILKARSLKQRWKDLLPLALVFVPVIGWYSYVNYYNELHNPNVFLQGLLPIWELDEFDVKNNWRLLTTDLLPHYFNRWVLVSLFVLFLGILFIRRKKPTVLVAMSILVLMGVTVYILLFYQVFNHHDYYLINLLPLVPLLTLTLFVFLKDQFERIYRHWILKVVALIGVFFLSWSTAVHNTMYFDVGSDFVKKSFFLEEDELKLWQWYHWDYNLRFKHLVGIDPYLDSIGVTKDDLVYSMPDPSINISLYLMNRRGYTDYGFPEYRDADKVEFMIDRGVKYLVVNQPEALEREYLQPYLKDSIGSRGNTRIYRLSSNR